MLPDVRPVEIIVEVLFGFVHSADGSAGNQSGSGIVDVADSSIPNGLIGGDTSYQHGAGNLVFGKSKLLFQNGVGIGDFSHHNLCLLYTSPSPRDRTRSRMPSSA